MSGITVRHLGALFLGIVLASSAHAATLKGEFAGAVLSGTSAYGVPMTAGLSVRGQFWLAVGPATTISATEAKYVQSIPSGFQIDFGPIGSETLRLSTSNFDFLVGNGVNQPQLGLADQLGVKFSSLTNTVPWVVNQTNQNVGFFQVVVVAPQTLFANTSIPNPPLTETDFSLARTAFLADTFPFIPRATINITSFSLVVPEPAAIWLALTAVLALAVSGRARIRSVS